MSQSLKGYYRYTDIWYAWAEVLDKRDSEPMKAFLAHDALVHPDHPFHDKQHGALKMYQGRFSNGQSRLLFSSKQIAYTRYYIHAMGLTEKLIPLPWSNCLLFEGKGKDLELVTPVYFKNGGDLRNANKKIEKANKRLKGANSSHTARIFAFETARKFWGQRRGIWFSIDFEAWERDHKLITEFGYSVMYWTGDASNRTEVEERGHYIVQEHRGYTNGYYVHDGEQRDQYSFGHSVDVRKKDFGLKVTQLFQRFQALNEPIFLIFHDNSQDLKYLNMIDAPVQNLEIIMPDDISSKTDGMYTFDTADLFAALEGRRSGNKPSLRTVVNQLQLRLDLPDETRWAPFHNAGNDSEFTLLAMKAMASGEPVEAQRQSRWPGANPDAILPEIADSDDEDFYGVPFKPVTEEEAMEVEEKPVTT